MQRWVVALGAIVAALALVGVGAGLGAYQASRVQTSEILAEAGPISPRMAGGHLLLDGPMQESMMDALAKALGLSPEELDNRLEAGRSLASIAEEQGQSVEQLRSAWSDAWQEALDAAVKEGQLTQEEADWMRDHMSSPQLEARPLWGDGRPGMFPRTGRGPGSEMPQWDSD